MAYFNDLSEQMEGLDIEEENAAFVLEGEDEERSIIITNLSLLTSLTHLQYDKDKNVEFLTRV